MLDNNYFLKIILLKYMNKLQYFNIHFNKKSLCPLFAQSQIMILCALRHNCETIHSNACTQQWAATNIHSHTLPFHKVPHSRCSWNIPLHSSYLQRLLLPGATQPANGTYLFLQLIEVGLNNNGRDLYRNYRCITRG